MQRGDWKLYEIKVDYTEQVVKRAAMHFVLRYVRRDTVVGLVMIFFAFGEWVTEQMEGRFAAMLALGGFVLIGMISFVGLRYVRSAWAKFRSMNIKQVVWRFDEDFLASDSDLGSVKIRWQQVSAVWRYPEVWLLFLGKSGSGYSTLPTESLSSEVREFVLDRIQEKGGRIS
jgi:hypothetical protein